MSGLILIAVLWIWFLIAKSLSAFFTQQMQLGALKKLAQVLLFVLILVLPVADEIVGGFQFRALCKAEAVAIYDEAKVRGKTVKYKSGEVIHYAHTILPIYKQVWIHIVDGSEKDSITIVDLYSDGGWLSRWINFNSVHRPYTFKGVCSGNKDDSLWRSLEIKRYINGISGETM